MLKLTRNISQSVFLHTSDGVIEVTICSVDGCQVRLGFDAPQSVNIVRSEIAVHSTLQHLATNKVAK
ncbi:MAG: carbon storage regulator [Pseudomonadota bacterium]